VRGSLAEYRCDILDCLSENQRAFARMRFSGRHAGPFRGDLYGLDEILRANAGS
jgi:hypothetical protein